MQEKLKNLRIALVHDFLDSYGGAERVLAVLAGMFPTSPIYTLIYDQEKMRGKFKGKDIRTSFLQKLPTFLKKHKRYLLPLLATAPETFDLREFDLVISSSGAWSKGIVTRLRTIHVSYLHSPMRFAWDTNGTYLEEQKKGKTLSFFARLIMNYIRVWDRVAADRPDYLVSNSRYTQRRVKKYYGRESAVIYPPVCQEEGRMKNEEGRSGRYQVPDNKYFLIVSRLSPYKKIDAAIEAFNKLELPLVIIGEGEQEKYLKRIAGKNVQILGWRPDADVADYYRGARAFVFPGMDDFGLAPLEAMSVGVPVIAIRGGGITEIVEEGKTGEFFDAAIPEVIADGVRRFIEKEENYDKEEIKNKAREFSEERFRREFQDFLEKIL